MEISCSWPLHIRSSIANELCLTHLTRSRTLLRHPSGGSYAPDTIDLEIFVTKFSYLKLLCLKLFIRTIPTLISNIVHTFLLC